MVAFVYPASILEPKVIGGVRGYAQRRFAERKPERDEIAQRLELPGFAGIVAPVVAAYCSHVNMI